MSYKNLNVFLLMLMSLFLFACGQLYEIEFSTVASDDGQTYIVIKENKNKSCSPLTVNGSSWKHPYNIPVLVSPGVYKLTCKLNDLEVTIEQGQTLIYLSQAKFTV